MGLAQGLIVLDETVVGVALPTIGRDLGISHLTTHWIVNGYLLTLAGLAMAAGKLGDLLGLQRIFLIGCLIFIVASLAAGFAESGLELILMRVLQGVGAAAIFPTAYAMITTVFAPEHRGLAFGIQTGISCVFISLGPLVGGYFSEVITWRWIFLINVPIIAIAGLIVALTWRQMPSAQTPVAFDTAGLIAMIVALGAISLAAMQGPDWGWVSAAVIAATITGLISLAVFVRRELSISHPLIKLRMFADLSFAGASLVIFAGQLCKLAVIVFGAVYLQRGLNLSPFEAGLAMLPAVLPTVVGALAAGHLSDRFGEVRPALVGLTCSTLALFALGIAASYNSYWWIVGPFVLWGFSAPFAFVPIRRLMLSTVAEADRGQAGGIALTSQLLGGIFGMALVGTIVVVTDNFGAGFLVAATVCCAILIFGIFSIRAPDASTV